MDTERVTYWMERFGDLLKRVVGDHQETETDRAHLEWMEERRARFGTLPDIPELPGGD
jgi:hypothetical protein